MIVLHSNLLTIAMRIRPNIPDRLLVKAKRYAAKRGIGLSQLAIEAVQEKFSRERRLVSRACLGRG